MFGMLLASPPCLCRPAAGVDRAAGAAGMACQPPLAGGMHCIHLLCVWGRQVGTPCPACSPEDGVGLQLLLMHMLMQMHKVSNCYFDGHPPAFFPHRSGTYLHSVVVAIAALAMCCMCLCGCL